jgi:hypothetical protein
MAADVVAPFINRYIQITMLPQGIGAS